MIKIKQINNEEVKPVVPQYGGSSLPIKGEKLFSDAYSNIFLCARKKSGKTSTINKILRETMGRDTQLICFVSTIHKDSTWKEITKYFEDKGNIVEKHMSITENGVNLLDDMVKALEAEGMEEEKEEKEPMKELLKKQKIVCFNDDEEECERIKKRKKPKYIAPDYIFVLDDLSTELKNTALTALLKKNRHFKCKVIVSSQYVHDMPPQSLKQIDYFLVFGNMPEEKLMHIYKICDLPVSFELFYSMYKKATEDKYNFFYVDIQKVMFRKNFNKSFILPESI